MEGRTADRFSERKNGLPEGGAQSLFQDTGGRVWASTYGGLVYFERDRLSPVDGQPGNEAASISGDEAGSLWVSGPGVFHAFKNGRFVETFSWSALGRRTTSQDYGSGPRRRLAGILARRRCVVFQGREGPHDLHVRGRPRRGPCHGSEVRSRSRLVGCNRTGRPQPDQGRPRPDALDREWSAVQYDSLVDRRRPSVVVDVHGLRSGACTRDELDAWIADPARKVVTQRWGVADGIPIRAVSPTYFNPPVAKAADGKFWLVSGEGLR